MKPICKSRKLENVLYDIRGPVVEQARQLEEEGYQILKLNTGNPAPFGLFAPDEILHDMILNLKDTQGYCDSKGLFSARKAIFQDAQKRRVPGIAVEDIYTGNGASEVIVMAMQALLNDGDEMLIPSPDYPLWTASVNLSGGKPVHYLCDESAEWYPDLADIERKITDRTRGIVVINPNNPTGAVYPRELLEAIVEIARRHDLIVFADEIYDKILYDDAEHVSIASLADDILFVTINGLSKAYRVAGFRAGWMMLSGDKSRARDYIQGLEMLASMRLCSNVPGQSIIQTSLGGYQTIADLTAPGGRLREQRDLCYRMLSDIPGVSCVKPKGAFYVFPRIAPGKHGIVNDERFVLDLLRQEHVLVVHGTGFNWPDHDHFRMVFLPPRDELEQALGKITRFLGSYRQAPESP